MSKAEIQERAFVLFPINPDQNVAKRFEQTQKKTDLIWDFRVMLQRR